MTALGDAWASWRLAAALGIAVALHLALVFGLGSPFPALTAPRSVIEVTLAAPKPADAVSARTLAAAETPAEEFVPAPAVESASASPTPDAVPEVAHEVVPETPAAKPVPAPPARPVWAAPREAYAGLVRDVAKLGAATPPQRGDVRVRRLDAAAPQTSEDAYYLAAWRREVERVGNLNYPQAARAQRLYGRLQLLVAIAADGSLRDARVLESSGHAELDAAALRIVRLAAPYAPLPPAMRRDTDVLEIVRTWQFVKQRGGRFHA